MLADVPNLFYVIGLPMLCMAFFFAVALGVYVVLGRLWGPR